MSRNNSVCCSLDPQMSLYEEKYLYDRKVYVSEGININVGLIQSVKLICVGDS